MNVTMTRPNMVLKTTAITELMMMISGLSALYCIASKTQSIYMSLYDECTSTNVIISVTVEFLEILFLVYNLHSRDI